MTAGPKVLHVAGWGSCGFYCRVRSVLSSLSILFPTKLKVIDHEFADRSQYRAWLINEEDQDAGGFRNNFKDSDKAQSHTSSPFLWFASGMPAEGEATCNPDPAAIEKYLGGHDDTLAWCREFFSPADPNSMKGEAVMKDDGHAAEHGYEYDLIVIGGGSGGMAAAKEASRLGAKVACLDFVVPSPHGTTWGLGGTCVNVGCIPKKLYHIGATMRQAITEDAPTFGITPAEGELEVGKHGEALFKTKVEWETVKSNIQNYIRGLNFKYRVRLREKEVAYFNKFAKFVDAHTIEATDKKGRTNTMTASRFLIATGGRPSPLSCEGGELAISSDDVFFLEKDPGKVLCVGASYISLECAGFLAGMGNDVTVAVRSILLRGFDRECSDRIGEYMEGHGINMRKGITPSKLSKTEDGRIQVDFSDGTSDVFDTVLAAIGRYAETAKLNLDAVGVKVNPKNLKIVTKNEQSSVPNIYAVGDVMDGCPELTPVAIQAGLLLANRLFGGSNEPMDYEKICTTVFTPIEYSCVGLSEDDAIERFGEENIEVFHSEFLPLEWSLSQSRAHTSAFTKVIVDKSPEQNVLGMHFVGPNAGEVMQGYGVAMKDGMTYKSLINTVGIHPTSSEEIVTLTITKSSGEDAAAGGC